MDGTRCWWLPDSDYKQTLRAVRQCAPETTALVVSGYPDAEMMAEALKCGAGGYLLKGRDDREREVVVRAISEAWIREHVKSKTCV